MQAAASILHRCNHVAPMLSSLRSKWTTKCTLFFLFIFHLFSFKEERSCIAVLPGILL